MVQNRNRLVELFIGNASNAIVHEILERAIDDESIRNRYSKELKVSLGVAKMYREKINPVNQALPDKDKAYIREKIIRKVKAELQLRISKGYENIDLSLVEASVENVLRDTSVI